MLINRFLSKIILFFIFFILSLIVDFKRFLFSFRFWFYNLREFIILNFLSFNEFFFHYFANGVRVLYWLFFFVLLAFQKIKTCKLFYLVLETLFLLRIIYFIHINYVLFLSKQTIVFLLLIILLSLVLGLNRLLFLFASS